MKAWILLLIIFTILVVLDKGITAYNLTQVKKNFPQSKAADGYGAEVNPVARWFFNSFGLFGGTIIYGILSILTLFIAFGLLRLLLNFQWSLYSIMIIYAFVLMNNIFFAIKYSGGFIFG